MIMIWYQVKSISAVAVMLCSALCILYYTEYVNGQDIAVVDPHCCKTQYECFKCCTKNTITGDCPGCISGYFGGLCKNICPKNCTSCTDHPNASSNLSIYASRGYCVNCVEGYFSTPDLYQCQTPCPDGCKTCVSFASPPNNCDSCEISHNLVLRSVTAGQCSKCPNNCLECSSDDSCSECKVGHHGSSCSNLCSNGCKNSKCSIDTGFCEDGCNTDGYISGGNCDVCVDGRYGTECANVCSANCRNICDKITGYCSECKGDFSGNLCEDCRDGFYGENCNTECPVNCKQRKCHQTSGFCVECVEGFNGDQCSDCSPGKYGDDCDQRCPFKCEGKVCDRMTGDCDKCVGHFTGSKCDHCSDGYYLNDVTTEITDASYCYKCKKTCKTCHSLDKCHQCVTGFWGEACHQNCSVGCKNNTCEQSSGICSYNCSVGFNGSKCDECSQGKYGNSCSFPCPENCLVCDRYTGDCVRCHGNFTDPHCEDCNVGVYGENCNQTCPEHCNHSQCDRYTRNCSFGCEELFTGPTCEECVLGKYGHRCNRPCLENCFENTCMIYTGDCYNCSGNYNGSKCEDCINGFFVVNCTENCSANCEGSLCYRLDKIRSLMCMNYNGNQVQDDENEVDGGTVAAGVVVTPVLLAFVVTLAFVFRRRLQRRKISTPAVSYENQVISEGQERTNTGDVTGHCIGMQSNTLDLRRELERLKVERRAIDLSIQELTNKLDSSERRGAASESAYESLRVNVNTDGLYSSLVKNDFK